MVGHAYLYYALLTAPAAGSAISGAGSPIDGDSLAVGQQEVRLHGIDAPELGQNCNRNGQTWDCGRAAADQLNKLIAGQSVSCVSVGRDRYGRMLGQCRVGDRSLNQAMVATGYALAYRRYSSAYVSAEESAKLAKRGIWSGTFDRPSEIREAGEDYRETAIPAEPSRSGEVPRVINGRSTASVSGNCRIKGNHSRKGELIYHLPGMPYYAETRAEAMFCSEAQARAAGYRRSRADQHR